MSTESCVGALLERATTGADAIAIRFRHLGVWQTTTWRQYGAAVEANAAGLALLGVGFGARVGILAENSPEWLISFFAIQLAGAVPVVVAPDASAEVVRDLFASQSVSVVIAGDQEQFDKVDDARATGALPLVNHLVVVATRGMRFLDGQNASIDSAVMAWSKLANSSGPGSSAVSPNPTGVVLVHDGTAREFSQAQLRTAGHRVVESLGVSSADECMALGSFADSPSLNHDVIAPVLSGMTVSMSPVPDLFLREIPEIRPTLVAVPSRVMGRIYADASRRAAATRGLKRIAYRAALRRGGRRSPKVHSAVSPLVVASVIVVLVAFVLASIPDSKQPLNRLGPGFVLALTFAAVAIAGGFTSGRSVRNLYGLGRVRSIAVYGEALDPAVDQWFRAIGVPVEVPRPDGTASVHFLTELEVPGV